MIFITYLCMANPDTLWGSCGKLTEKLQRGSRPLKTLQICTALLSFVFSLNLFRTNVLNLGDNLCYFPLVN